MPPDSNNRFGIKALPGQPAVESMTNEFEGGEMVTKPQGFRKFDTLTDAFEIEISLAPRPHYCRVPPNRNESIMTSAYQSLEHHEHAGHIAHGEHGENGGHGNNGDQGSGHAGAAKPRVNSAQWTALLVAFLAAGLAIGEQGAKHAEIRVQQEAIDAADAWAQYQAKSTRGTVAKDVSAIIAVMDVGTDPAAIARRDDVIAKLRAEQDAFESDPKDGKQAIARRARHIEEERHHSLEQTHTYHNGSASYELGIVLATASAITRNKPLLYISMALGVCGVIFSLLGYLAPELGAL